MPVMRTVLVMRFDLHSGSENGERRVAVAT
jgi:hypothetical protein